MRKTKGKKCTTLISLNFFHKRKISKQLYFSFTAYHAITIQPTINKIQIRTIKCWSCWARFDESNFPWRLKT